MWLAMLVHQEQLLVGGCVGFDKSHATGCAGRFAAWVPVFFSVTASTPWAKLPRPIPHLVADSLSREVERPDRQSHLRICKGHLD
jgi:hypothetical protein